MSKSKLNKIKKYYTLLQLPKSCPYFSFSYDDAITKDFNPNDYVAVYSSYFESSIKPEFDDIDVLECIEQQFCDKENYPKFFANRPLYASDVVIISDNKNFNTFHIYYCDAFGWVEITSEFLTFLQNTIDK